MMMDYYPEGRHSCIAANKRLLSTLSGVEEAMRQGTILEATATMCDADHNLIVNLGSMRGIIPREEGAIGIAEGAVRDIALISRVGKSVCFVVKEIKTDNEGKLFAILSRKSAQQKCREDFLDGLIPGDVIDARVTHLESFGAFCDIGCGIIALLPIDSISVSRISHPSDRFNVGADLKVVIKEIMPDGKIMLSLKELLGTWQENAELLSSGQTVTGVIRSVESYGVFVELTPNLAGLAEPKSNVFAGQQASVYIKSIIPEKMKVKLIIIDSFENDYITPIKYFSNETHIDVWEYSPKESTKKIYTQF